jgi:sugar lactone lactonase YvrE
MTDVEVVVEAGNLLGEGPVWDVQDEALWWTDILDNALHRYVPVDDEHQRFPVDASVGSFALAIDGRLVLATEDGFASCDPASPAVTVVHRCVQAPLRMNDGKCDPAGRFWAGTVISSSKDAPGALYVLDTDRSVRVALERVVVSNGLGWSPDATTMYFIDTGRMNLDRFDYDVESGTITARETLVHFSGSDGGPDGMTVDAEGGLWVAMWGGGKVKCFEADGRLRDEIEVPTPNPTSCAFGGADLSDLYITSATSKSGRPGGPTHPSPAGALFRVAPGVNGLPMSRYAGATSTAAREEAHT